MVSSVQEDRAQGLREHRGITHTRDRGIPKPIPCWTLRTVKSRPCHTAMAGSRWFLTWVVGEALRLCGEARPGQVSGTGRCGLHFVLKGDNRVKATFTLPAPYFLSHLLTSSASKDSLNYTKRETDSEKAQKS